MTIRYRRRVHRDAGDAVSMLIISVLIAASATLVILALTMLVVGRDNVSPMPLWVAIAVLYIAHSLSATLFYGQIFRMDLPRRYYLADMPWGTRIWPWVTAVLLGPIGAITLLCSYLLFLDARPRYEDDFPEGYGYHLLGAGTHGPQGSETVELSELPVYADEPDEALSGYQNYRSRKTDQYRSRQIQEADEMIKRLEDDLQELSKQLREKRDRRTILQAERASLVKILENTASDLDPKVIAEEFERIMRLPGVIGVKVVNGNVRFIIRAINRHQGESYYMGDWRVDIGPNISQFNAVKLRGGERLSSAGFYGSNTFCFGGRSSQLMGHFERGQFLEGMALIVECLSSVNPGHSGAVPEYFMRITGMDEPEAASAATAASPSATEEAGD